MFWVMRQIGVLLILKCLVLYMRFLLCYATQFSLILFLGLLRYGDSAEINSRILTWIHQGEHRLTKENYEDYWENIRDFYGSYDYEQLFS